MKPKELERRLRRALQFPRVWFASRLMSPELARQQLSSLRRHFGTRSRPVRGSEHWRYGAFQFILREVKDELTLAAMLPLAYEDRDAALSDAMINDIRKHPLAGSEVERSNKRLQATRSKQRAPGAYR
jgi:hypothetical protein